MQQNGVMRRRNAESSSAQKPGPNRRTFASRPRWSSRTTARATAVGVASSPAASATGLTLYIFAAINARQRTTSNSSVFVTVLLTVPFPSYSPQCVGALTTAERPVQPSSARRRTGNSKS